MRKDTGKRISGILARYRRHSAWQKVVRVMACAVVFCTTYALILPAVTLEKKPACGKEEHIHTESCYTQVTSVKKSVPVCTQEGLSVHQHTDACQDESCGEVDFVVHKHDGRCYDENGQLWCFLPEIEAHTHDESCFETPETHVHGEGCYTREKADLTCTESTEAAHTHAEGCYAPEKKLVCALTEGEGHVHGEGCQDESGAFICGQEEAEGHTHNDACYEAVLTCTESTEPTHVHNDACYIWNETLTCTESTEPKEPVLTCEKKEILLHEHTQEDCYETDEEGNSYLVCDKIQILEHVHTDDCFETVEEAVDTESRTCGTDQGAGAHAHMESCYDQDKNLICGQGHRHTERCYGTWELNCGQEEHTHTPECMVDVESEEDWKKTLPQTLSGDWRKDLLAVAESQLDYTEARPDLQLGEDTRRCSRYGTWYGQPDGEWNSLLVMFCLHYAQIPEESLPQDSDTAAWVEKLAGRAEGFEAFQLYRSEEDYTPEPGDLVFLGVDEDEAADRVGIVASVTAATEDTPASLEVIEGNVSGKVVKQNYPIEGVRILGYGQIPEKPVVKPVEPELICGKEEHRHTELCTSLSPDGKSLILTCGKEEHAHTEDCYSSLEYTWSQDGLEITAVFAPTASLPENAQLTVERFTPETPMPLAQVLNAGNDTETENDMALQSSEQTEENDMRSQASDGTDAVTEGNASGAVPSSDGTTPSNDTSSEPGTGEQASMIPTDADTQTSPGDSGTDMSADTTPEETPAADPDIRIPAEGESSQQEMRTCLDYFRVCLTADGAEVEAQAPAQVQIRLQGQQYQSDADIQLIQLTEDAEQTLLAQPDADGSLTAAFTGSPAGDYAVMALAAPRAAGTNAAASITPNKTIDSFRDGEPNPDTTLEDGKTPEENKRLYRLYLDAQVGPSTSQPMDLLLVVDESGSMDEEFERSGGRRVSKKEAIENVLNGTNGLVSNFLNRNAGNHVAVVGFSDEAYQKQGWTSTSFTTTLGRGVYTNYTQAYQEAEKMLNEARTKWPDNKKIVVFLSDGGPTRYLNSSGQFVNVQWTANPTDESKAATKTYFDNTFWPANQDVKLDTVQIKFEGEVLAYMAAQAGGTNFTANSSSELLNALETSTGGFVYTNAKIEDILSDYVDIHPTQPDYKVTKRDAQGNETLLWEGNSATEAGNRIIQSVVTNGKTVTATFVPDYILEPDCTYTLSYNVEVTQTAYDEYARTKYPHTGDQNTDYGTNYSSSGVKGFHSNESATLSYDANDVPTSKTYPHPVVQVDTPMPTPQPELTLTPHKTIDAFRDGADNKDTDLDNTASDKTDLYRLYLDAQISSQTQPIDLLLVVDQSGSMHDNYSGTESEGPDMKDYDGQAIYRDQALNLVLNGANGNDGLIAKFLNANEDNWLAVASFQADTASTSSDYGKNEASYAKDENGKPIIDYKKNGKDSGDANTLLNWTQTPPSGGVTTEGKYANATNYMAGFQQADMLLNSETIKNNGHKKVMIFLSDGKPTCHIATDGYGNYWRAGDGRNEDTKGDSTLTTAQATDAAFTKFVEDHPELLIHTVSLKSGDATTRLQTMASPGVGHSYSVHDTDDLRKALSKLMYGTAFTEMIIQDTLSEEVDLYTADPDYKVTLTIPGVGEPIPLYEDGQITEAAKGILKTKDENGQDYNPVRYDPDTKKVSVEFNYSYAPAPGSKVTLSFNVKTNEKAYEKYTENKKQEGNNGYGTVTGDPDTDYPGNGTSSNQPGFYSNDFNNTKVTYKRYNNPTPEEQKYPKPVVQVTPTNLKVEKKWLSYDGQDITASQSAVDSVSFNVIKTGTTALPPDTAAINVTSEYYYYSSRWNNGWVDGRGLTRTDAPIGSKAVLKIQLAETTGVTVNVSKNNGPKELASLENGVFTYEFTVPAENTSIRISCQKSPNYSQASDPILGLTCDYRNIPSGESVSQVVSSTPYTLEKSKGWVTVIENLPKSGTMTYNGEQVSASFTYSVEEVAVPGYSSGVAGPVKEDALDSYTITNKSNIPDLILQKVNSKNPEEGLEGAKFELYRKLPDGETGVELKGLTGAYTLVSEGDSPAGVKPATDANGMLTFKGLIPGDYALVETQAPKGGFHKSPNPITFRIGTTTTVDGKVTATITGVGTSSVAVGTPEGETKNMLVITVPNDPWGHELPEAGGTGNELYTLGGLLIISFAVLLLYSKKRGKGDAVSS